MDGKANGKTVIITGGSKGIGAAAVRRFARDGWNVVINYLKDGEKAESLCGELAAQGCDTAVFRADVSDCGQAARLTDFAVRRYGRVDALVNNAGVAWQGLTQDMSEEDFCRVMAVNFGGVFHCTKAVLPHMIRQHGGSIVNVSSVLGVTGASCESVYAASKAAIIGFTSSLSKEVGPSGIRVNAVAPGVIETDMNLCHDEQTMRSLAECSALLRNGTAAEVAQLIAFLAGEGASFITGQTVRVDGNVLL